MRQEVDTRTDIAGACKQTDRRPAVGCALVGWLCSPHRRTRPIRRSGSWSSRRSMVVSDRSVYASSPARRAPFGQVWTRNSPSGGWQMNYRKTSCPVLIWLTADDVAEYGGGLTWPGWVVTRTRVTTSSRVDTLGSLFDVWLECAVTQGMFGRMPGFHTGRAGANLEEGCVLNRR